MTKISRNAKVFGVLVVLYALVFHNYLSQFLSTGQWEKIVLAAIALFGSVFIAGLILGAFDPVHKSRSDLSFQYHLVTYVTINITGILWLISGLASDQEYLSHALLMALSWGIGLIIHWLISRKTIKGVSNASVFD